MFSEKYINLYIKRYTGSDIYKMEGGIGGKVLYVIFAIILIVAVAIPVTTQVIVDANLTGTTATVVGFIPLFLALAGLAVAAALIVF